MGKEVRLRFLRGLGPGLLLALLFTLIGCGGPSASVSGKVTYKGQPLNGGTVVFQSTDGKWGGSSAIAEDGTYTIPKVPPGQVKIGVETKSVNPTVPKGGGGFMFKKGPADFKMKPPKDTAMPKDADKTFYGGDTKKYVDIPEKYADPEKSGLTYTVTAGKQIHNIDLK
ncbi:MAG TPA: carboxypeptidase-like regulatory domain-containing protein [Gemmataceae bacterium]|nr:carboxypeptidase-like regulatory domain-containing protein [Gemmataceae bacterium]